MTLQPAALEKAIEAYNDATDIDAQPASRCALEAAIQAYQDAIAPGDGLVGRHSVPWQPTEPQWSGLARDIVMWMDCYQGSAMTPRNLFLHLERVGADIPQWLRDEPEMQHLDHVPSKGTRATIIYKAMIAAAPTTALSGGENAG